MLSAYRLGQLTAQPQKLEKMAEKSQLKRSVMQKFAAESKVAVYETPGGGTSLTPPTGGGIMDKLKGLAGTAGEGLSRAGQGIASGSEYIGGKLGGTAGGSGMANPHARTIMALLALLGTGYGASKLVGGGGDKKEV